MYLSVSLILKGRTVLFIKQNNCVKLNNKGSGISVTWQTRKLPKTQIKGCFSFCWFRVTNNLEKKVFWPFNRYWIGSYLWPKRWRYLTPCHEKLLLPISAYKTYIKGTEHLPVVSNLCCPGSPRVVHDFLPKGLHEEGGRAYWNITWGHGRFNDKSGFAYL